MAQWNPLPSQRHFFCGLVRLYGELPEVLDRLSGQRGACSERARGRYNYLGINYNIYVYFGNMVVLVKGDNK